MNTTYPLQWVAGIISIFLPNFLKQDEKRIVLTSFHGDGYRGNTKVIFEQLCKHSYFRPVWLSRKRKVVDQIKSKFGDETAALTYSFAGLKSLASASAILFTHGTSDYPFLRLPRRAFKIQTYHGLPTKRGEYMRPKSERPPNFFHKLILKYRFKPIDCFLSTSPFVSDIFSQRFGLKREQIAETGYPCYDKLIKGVPDPMLIDNLWPGAPKCRKVVLYSPTYRKFSKTKWFPFDDFEPVELSRFLEKENILMLMRPHPNEQFDISEFKNISDRFMDASQQTIEDVYSLLLITDAIITDYSSIFIEGLLRDIPTTFIPYDIESYERGLPFNYQKTTPGDKVLNQTEFLCSLKTTLDHKERYESEMERVRSLFFSTTDGNATKNVIKLLEKSIPGKRNTNEKTG